jgi:SAM-dependent methyltransferase
MKKLDCRENFFTIIDLNKYKVCAEIGVQKGNFSEYLLKSKTLTDLYLIDCWTPQENYLDMANIHAYHQDFYYQYVINRYMNDDRVKIIKEFSIEACCKFEPNFFDFIYLDADHSYDVVKKDIENWYKKLKIGGILAGHDYLDGILPQGNFGVKTAVDEFTKKHNHELFITDEEEWKSWYFYKKS